MTEPMATDPRQHGGDPSPVGETALNDDEGSSDALGGFRRDVDVLLQALPYIQQFRGATVVVKFGGNAMVDAALANEFARDIVLMHQVGLRPVVVHGGGPQIGAWLDRLGLTSSFVGGRRVTTAETLEVASMVLVGKVNHELVASINAHHPVAVGLSGSAAQLLELTPAAEELGFVGQVTNVKPELIKRLLDEQLVPVISTIGTAGGQSYNVNADDVAAAVAEALRAERDKLTAELAQVQASHQQMRQAYQQRDLPLYFRLNREIHAAINACARNPVLSENLAGLSRMARDALPGCVQIGLRHRVRVAVVVRQGGVFIRTGPAVVRHPLQQQPEGRLVVRREPQPGGNLLRSDHVALQDFGDGIALERHDALVRGRDRGPRAALPRRNLSPLAAGGLVRHERDREPAGLVPVAHVCQRCGREFSGKRLRELTVHHKDGDHFNNPPDGSNWALLCLYCHDDEHGTYEQRGLYAQGATTTTTTSTLGYNAFEGLRNLLPPEPKDDCSDNSAV